MLWTPQAEFHSIVSNLTGQPAAGALGTAITPGTSNSKGSYTQIIAAASMVYDSYGIFLNINNGFVSTTTRNMLIDIGVDLTNSSSYSVLIPNLLVPGTSAWGTNITMGGVSFYFPIFIPAGAQIGARAQTSDATAGTVSVWAELYGQPKNPHLTKVGTQVTAYGAATGTTLGVTVTPGTTAEGAWADLSGADTTIPHWWWQFGFGVADTTVSNELFSADYGVGDGSNKLVVASNSLIMGQTAEMFARPLVHNGAYSAPVGVRPYGRLQGPTGAGTSGWSMTAYGVS